ncbi:MAG: hypothetical protein Udaeo2_19650 [Candidatus Udaeobacter sp.]|nr:MAG: hypothetical protein Udaeo2_19650 [Candidatus Udaeobacter sp.]
MPAQPRKATIQKIKYERAENTPDGSVKRSLAASGLTPVAARLRIFSVAVNPQNRFPAVIKLGRR